MDYSGGGEHVRMMISLLSNSAEIFVTKRPEFYGANDFAITKIDNPPKKFRYDFVPDLFIYIDFRGYIKPIGRANAQVVFYGLKKYTAGYDYAICINDFVARSVGDNFSDTKPVVIPPFFDSTTYSAIEKQKKLINIGNFFRESDGHSKNQHLLIDWFLDSGLVESGWTFDFFGFKNNGDYFQELETKVARSPAIRLHPNSHRSDIVVALSQSRFLVHAMGYGRLKPEQTEHFGLVAVESLLSGCRPIVHRSGGCHEIEGTLSYTDLEEIKPLIQSDDLGADKLREFGLNFNYEKSLLATEKFLNEVKALLKKKGEAKFFPDRLNLLRYMLRKK